MHENVKMISYIQIVVVEIEENSINTIEYYFGGFEWKRNGEPIIVSLEIDLVSSVSNWIHDEFTGKQNWWTMT